MFDYIKEKLTLSDDTIIILFKVVFLQNIFDIATCIVTRNMSTLLPNIAIMGIIVYTIKKYNVFDGQE